MATINYSTIKGFEGYRIGDNGTVWTCWKFQGRGRGVPPVWFMDHEEWRQLAPAVDRLGRKSFRLRLAEKKYVRKQLGTLMTEAFGRRVNNAG